MLIVGFKRLRLLLFFFFLLLMLITAPTMPYNPGSLFLALPFFLFFFFLLELRFFFFDLKQNTITLYDVVYTCNISRLYN